MVDEAGVNGKVCTIPGRLGPQDLTQGPGELNGVAGRYEWIVNAVGNLTHQMFVKAGKINGSPTSPDEGAPNADETLKLPIHIAEGSLDAS